MSASKVVVASVICAVSMSAQSQTVNQLTDWSKTALCREITKDFGISPCPGIAATTGPSAASAPAAVAPAPAPVPPAPVLRGINGVGSKLNAMLSEGGEPVSYSVGQSTAGGWKIVSVTSNAATVVRGTTRKDLQYRDGASDTVAFPPAVQTALPVARPMSGNPTPSPPGTLSAR